MKPDLRSLHHAVEDFNALEVPSGRKRRRNSSSDSSFLKPAAREASVPVKHKHKHKQRVLSDQSLERQPRRHSEKQNARSLDSGSSSKLNVRHETFEKRARHKTREDRYETKKKEKTAVKDVEDKPRAKRVKRGDGARAARKAGERLMNSFTSKSIGQDRLTVS